MDIEITKRASKSKRKRPSSATTRHLLIFATLFGIAMVSGFYFYFVPHKLNWRASQIVLIIHFIVGLLTFVPFGYFVFKHQRQKEKRSIFLIAPWKVFKRQERESDWHYRQRLWGHALYWSIVIVLLSSFFVSIPAVLYYMGNIFLPGYPLYQISNAVHLIFSVVAAILIVIHLSHRKKRQRQNNQGDSQ